jgi:hypothetical protein
MFVRSTAIVVVSRMSYRYQSRPSHCPFVAQWGCCDDNADDKGGRAAEGRRCQKAKADTTLTTRASDSG